jgi:D-sedoheptulose 7-phosphate isomerase
VILPSLHAALEESRRLLDALSRDADATARFTAIAELLAATFRAGGKVLVCGNGGSACDAAHFAEELTGRFRKDRPPLPALACTEAGHITCTANDFGFEHVFARWIAALARPGDLVMLLSTSGNSANLLRARQAAERAGARTVALLGRGGGELRGRCDLELIVPGSSSDRIQELQMLLLHALVEHVEAALFPDAR